MPGLRSIARAEGALLLLLVVAAGARFWGLAFGLPDVDARPDESLVIDVALGFFTGDPNPHFFRYPTLYMYCLFALYACYYLWGRLAGLFATPSDLVSAYLSDPSAFVLLSRSLSAIAGTATIYVVYQLGRHVTDRKVGLVAAFFLALAHLHVRDSHFGVTDVAATALAVCSVLFILRAADWWRPRDWLIAGGLAGLAAATKYAGGLLVVPAALAIGLCSRQRQRLAPALLFICGLVVTFALGCPFALLDAGRFVSDLASDSEHLRLGHRLVLGRGWWYHFRYTLPIGLGRTLFWAALAGLPVLAKRDSRRGAILLSFPLAYYAVSGIGFGVFARYMLPVIPFLCITAAALYCAVVALVSARGRTLGLVAGTAITLVIILPSVRKVVHTDRLLATTDSRQLATDWARREVPSGSAVYLAGPIWRRPVLSGSLERLAGGLAPTPTAPADPLLTFRLLDFDPCSGGFTECGGPYPGLPDYIFIRESPLLAIGGPPEGLIELVRRSYCLRAAFDALDLEASHWFDMQDGFFIPLAGFGGVERPGPNVYVYQRRDVH